MAEPIMDRVNSLRKQITDTLSGVDPSLLAAGAGAVGGAALGGLSGMGGKSKGRAGRVLRRSLFGAAGGGVTAALLSALYESKQAQKDLAGQRVTVGEALLRNLTQPASWMWKHTLGPVEHATGTAAANVKNWLTTTPEIRAAQEKSGIKPEADPNSYASNWLNRTVTFGGSEVLRRNREALDAQKAQTDLDTQLKPQTDKIANWDRLREAKKLLPGVVEELISGGTGDLFKDENAFNAEALKRAYEQADKAIAEAKARAAAR